MGAAHPRFGPPQTIGEAEALLSQLQLPHPGRDRFVALGRVEGDSLKNALCCLANGDARAPQARAYLTAILSVSTPECLSILARLGYPEIPAETLSRCIKEGDIHLPALIREADAGNASALTKVRQVLSYIGNLEPVIENPVAAADEPIIEIESPFTENPAVAQESLLPEPDEAPVIQPAKPCGSLPSLIRCEDEQGQHGLSLIGRVMSAYSLPSALAVCMGWQKEALCGELILRYQSHGVKVLSSTSDMGFYERESLFEFSDAILRSILENRPHLSAESVLTMTKALFSGHGAR